jgi:hypothetical protein
MSFDEWSGNIALIFLVLAHPVVAFVTPQMTSGILKSVSVSQREILHTY